tara:strand:- start:1214 stop:1573 length:360 start_codon:yes stop_codon:yes gene_type:complete
MNLKSILIISAVLIIGGCATPNTGYYWENYSATLYNYKKNPNEKTMNKHIEMLEKIILKNESKGSRVPPGIHAELAYLLAQKGEKSQAVEHFQKEMIAYPESKNFVERINLMLGLKNDE